jgi:aspartyl-tRNA(Asn)/glutamyl-tRNA(Gln) amidotransferase subunit A
MDFLDAFKQCDIILGPVAPTPAWEKGTYSKNPAHMYLADIFTLSPSLAGLPCMSIPCGFTSSDKSSLPILPIGLQLIAPHFAESSILQVGNIYQKHTDWHMQGYIAQPSLQTA